VAANAAMALQTQYQEQNGLAGQFSELQLRAGRDQQAWVAASGAMFLPHPDGWAVAQAGAPPVDSFQPHGAFRLCPISAAFSTSSLKAQLLPQSLPAVLYPKIGVRHFLPPGIFLCSFG
jgi:hypothetical protein